MRLFYGRIKVERDETESFFLFPSAVWVFITLLPTLMLNTERRAVPLGVRDYVGWTIWGLGFAIQTIADQQKWLFKSDPDNAVSERRLYVDASFSLVVLTFLSPGEVHPEWAVGLQPAS